LAAGHGIQHLRARAAMVGEEVSTALREHLGLILHVLPAAGNEQEDSHARCGD